MSVCTYVSMCGVRIAAPMLVSIHFGTTPTRAVVLNNRSVNVPIALDATIAPLINLTEWSNSPRLSDQNRRH